MTSIPITDKLQTLISNLTHSDPPVFYQYQTFIDIPDLLPLSDSLSNEGERVVYWEAPEEEFSLLGIGQVYAHNTSGKDRFQTSAEIFNRIQERIWTEPETAISQNIPSLLYFNSFFSNIAPSEWNGFSPSLLLLPRILLSRQNGQTTVSLNIQIDAGADAESITTQLTQLLASVHFAEKNTGRKEFSAFPRIGPYLNGEKSRWNDSVNKSVYSIRHKNIDKVVLAKRSEIPVIRTAPLIQTLDSLRREYPTCVIFHFREQNGKSFFGATPEWLARLHDDILTCDALAGTIERDPVPERDVSLGEALHSSEKNRSEHDFVVRYLKKRMQPLADNIQIPESPSLKKLKNVQHLYTKMSGVIKPGISPFQVINQLHPTPAVGGIPSEKAQQFIQQIEQMERGYYAAPFGWIALDGDFDMAVGLRSGLMTPETLYLYAGAGIVEGSDPRSEYDELQLKLMPLLNVFNSVPVDE